MRRIAMTMAAAFVSLAIASIAAAGPPEWSATGSMQLPRRDHTATLLDNGKVLVQGWLTPAAELYDPITGTFTAAGDTAAHHGVGSTATRLLDGRVLLVGGSTRAAEIYDPASGTFALTGTPDFAGSYHTATRLESGRVLIVGGDGTGASAEIYDPLTASFAPTGGLNVGRVTHAAALLPDGRVLVVGGVGTDTNACLASAEIYDPIAASFSLVGPMAEARCGLWWSGAPVLANGKVLVAGGLILSSAELFDPATNTFGAAGTMTSPRAAPTATLLADGRVLIAGGAAAPGPVTVSTAELYDPVSSTFSATATMIDPRQQHTATLLRDGGVLVTGGFGGETERASAEVFSSENRPPDCSGVVFDRVLLWPPNHRMVGIEASGTDPDPGDAATVVIDHITQDEPIAGSGAGATSPDASRTGTNRFFVRAERDGDGDGRIYQVHFVATDTRGASCAGIGSVGVPIDQSGPPPVDSAPPSYDSLTP